MVRPQESFTRSIKEGLGVLVVGWAGCELGALLLAACRVHVVFKRSAHPLGALSAERENGRRREVFFPSSVGIFLEHAMYFLHVPGDDDVVTAALSPIANSIGDQNDG